jgi:threonylcarbamoyladenosine tRNA methylthiotransferase MtaB
VITGIHIGSYGTDRGSRELAELLKKINAVPGIERIRLGSLEPGTMDEAFLEQIASCEKICPHFHLSLQSGSDTILRKMNRHYTAQDFLECTERIRRYYDRPALTTDVIVGFPGETEELFRETVRFLETADFMKFIYSSILRGTVRLLPVCRTRSRNRSKLCAAMCCRS